MHRFCIPSCVLNFIFRGGDLMGTIMISTFLFIYEHCIKKKMCRIFVKNHVAYPLNSCFKKHERP